MYIYLAEPGDNNTGEWSYNITSLAEQIGQMGHTVFRPVIGWSWSVFDGNTDRNDLKRLNQINRTALDNADLLVAVLPPNTTSRGVPMEIGWASDAGIPVVLYTTEQIAASTLFKGDPNVHPAYTTDQAVALVERATAQGGLLPRGHHLNGHGQVPAKGTLPLKYVMDQGHPSHPDGLTKHYDSDAGYDLYTVEDTELAECQYKMIPCGVRVELPPGVFAWVVARSSTFPNWGIMVPPGIIDTGWRGEMAVPAWRVPSGSVWTTDHDQPYNQVVPNGHSPKSPDPFIIPAGTRLAQLVLFSNVASGYRPQLSDRIADADRGTNGFGSTGSGPAQRVVDVHAERWTPPAEPSAPSPADGHLADIYRQ